MVLGPEGTICVTLLAFVAGILCTLLWRSRAHNLEVLFFPDAKLPCDSYFEQVSGRPGYRCSRRNCNFSHNTTAEFTSLMKIIDHLSRARATVDLCVFEFTLARVAKFMIDLKKRGIKVRVITDAHRERRGEGKEAIMDQIPTLQKAGIEIRVNKKDKANRAKMHNKFAVIDNKQLIMGSFNWTVSGAIHNHEAVICTNERRVVEKFSRKFDQIWSICGDYELELQEVVVAK